MSAYLKPGLACPVASPDGLDAPFWQGLRDERLLLQRCESCNRWQWGPEWICHRCLSFELRYEQTAANGVIYSRERVWHPVHPALKDQGPYLIVLVELPHVGEPRVRPDRGAAAGLRLIVCALAVLVLSAGAATAGHRWRRLRMSTRRRH